MFSSKDSIVKELLNKPEIVKAIADGKVSVRLTWKEIGNPADGYYNVPDLKITPKFDYEEFNKRY